MKKKSTETAKNERQELELKAAKRVVPWTEIRPNDYHFRWASNEKKESLRAGCVYEYARESRKLRCLLVLINMAFEKRWQHENEQSRHPPGFQFLSFSYEGLRYKDALLWLGGWFGWLRKFTDELADNTSFAKLYEENESD